MRDLSVEERTYALATLARLIEARGHDQTQLHELSGVSQSQISKILSRQAEPTDNVLRKLFQGLGLKLEDVVSEATTATASEIVGYLATPLTNLDGVEERELERVVTQIRGVASLEEFANPSFDLYWPGDYTHPKRNKGFTAEQVYLTDRSRASAYDFIVLLCASPSYGVGQENEIATQAGLPAVRLVPEGLSRMMLGSFIRAIDVRYEGNLREGIRIDDARLTGALRMTRQTYFRHRALYKGMNGHGFGERLRSLVNDRCPNNEAFGHGLGVSLTYVHALLEQPLVVSNPSTRLLQRMSRHLDVSIGFLLGETSDTDPVIAESLASFRAWTESTTGIEASVANQLCRDWQEEYQRSRREPQLASLRSIANRALSQADWDRRYQEATKVRKGRGTHGVQKGLLDL